VAFAGRVLRVSNTRVECENFRTKYREENPGAHAVLVLEMNYPVTTTAESAFEWINGLLDGSILGTMFDQEIERIRTSGTGNE
jgi:hypothetical protein